MVVEMTSLQGIIGEIYALKSGETFDVATAIREHYLPRFSGDTMPKTTAGLALSLADKFDSLVGLFAAGAIPSGSADPFGLRRATLGIVNALLATETDFSIATGLAAAATLQPIEVSEGTLAEAATFVTRRLQGVLLDAGYAHDVVEAVRPHEVTIHRQHCELGPQSVRWWPTRLGRDLHRLRPRRTHRAQPGWDIYELNPGVYSEDVERALHDAALAAADHARSLSRAGQCAGRATRCLAAAHQ